MIFNHDGSVSANGNDWRIRVHVGVQRHINWEGRWEHVVAPPWRAPCEWMEVWLICSAPESHGWQGSSPLLAYSSLSPTANTLSHSHTFGIPSATRTIPLDSHNVINLKQTKIQRHHMMATKTNYANCHFKINLFSEISAVRCTIKVH